MTVLVVAAVCAMFAAVVLAWSGFHSPPPPSSTRPRVGAEPVAGAVAVAVVVFAVTGWVVFAAAAAFGTGRWLMVRAGRERGDALARIAGLATWVEQLRDLIRAQQGAVAPIVASRDTAPEAVRAEVQRLARGLQRDDPAAAFARFAAEFDDPDADMVATVLAASMSHSGSTSQLLNELAGAIRERAAARARIATARAADLAEAKVVTAMAIAGLAIPGLFARRSGFFAVYRTAAGEVVLAVVVAMITAAVGWRHWLARIDEPARFLTHQRTTGGGR